MQTGRIGTRRSFTIPQDLLREFKGDLRIISDDGTEGIWMPHESLMENQALMRKISQNFEVILVPKEFLQG